MTKLNRKAIEGVQPSTASVTPNTSFDTALATGVPVNGEVKELDPWEEHVRRYNLTGKKPVALPEEDPLVEVKDRVHGQLKAAMRAAGLAPPDVIEADGKLHRFATNGKHDDKSGWYVLHLNGIPAGTFGDWRIGLSQKWRADIGRKLTPDEEVLCKAQEDEMRCKREAEEEKNREHAKEWATDIWPKLVEATEHLYLTKKGIKAHGARRMNQALVIPLHVGTEIHSFQYLLPDGTKRFLEGGRVRGCYFSIGKPDKVLCIAEGFATGASIHEATGHPVAIAFNAGNLLPVAKTMRAKYPDIQLVLCADDDTGTEGNPGLTKATEAARAIDGYLAIPDFGEDRPEKATDFNDLARELGAEAVRNAIGKARCVRGTETPAVTGKEKRLTLVRGTDVVPEVIPWLWEHWLARGMFHVLAGAPGCGKTTIGIAMAATVSSGKNWPDEKPCPAGDVLIWSGEDSSAYTLVPRFLAAGGDPKHLYLVGKTIDSAGARPFDPATDMPELLEVARGIPNLSFIMVDPVVNAVLGDSHKNTEVRRALQPLVDLAEELKCVLFGITHFSKGTAGRDPVERVTGSVAFGALPRIAMAAAKMYEEGVEKRIFCRSKSNIGPDKGGWEFSLPLTDVPGYPGIVVTKMHWGAYVNGTAKELLAKGEDKKEGDRPALALEKAKTFLEGLLAKGPMESSRVKAAAGNENHSWGTIRRAQDALGIKPTSEEKGVPPFYWELPVTPF